MPHKSKQVDTTPESPLMELEDHAQFIRRHIGPGESQISHMLDVLGIESLDALIESTLPTSIQTDVPLALPKSKSEIATLNKLRGIADLNVLKHSMIGMGYHDTITPGVILRNILENRCTDRKHVTNFYPDG